MSYSFPRIKSHIWQPYETTGRSNSTRLSRNEFLEIFTSRGYWREIVRILSSHFFVTLV